MSKIGNLLILDRMSKKNLDIRLATLPDNLINARRVRAGGEVTLGVDHNAAKAVMNMAVGDLSYLGALIIFRRDQFDETEKELKLMKETGMGRSPLYDLEFDLLTRKQADPNAPGARMHPVEPKKDYDRSIHHNPDARAWAKFYCEHFPDSDLDTMIGWFANAMMAMHDHMMEKYHVIHGQWKAGKIDTSAPMMFDPAPGARVPEGWLTSPVQYAETEEKIITDDTSDPEYKKV